MKKSIFKKAVAGAVSTAMLCSAVPTSAGISGAAADGEVLFSTGFENGEGVDSFTGRKGVEVFEATTEDAYSGEYSMKVSSRENGWNGPQFLVDEMLEPNTEYMVSVAVKAEWYNDVKLSWEYTDTEGERHYNNLKSGTSNGDWVWFEDVKFSFTDEMTKVYVYVECGDTANLFIDDFSIEASPEIAIQEDIASLKDVYSPYFKIGTAITTSNLASKPFMNLVQKHFSESLTAGNEMKPEALLDQDACIEAGETNPQVTLTQARPFLNYCRDNNIPVRGHTLVWHSQTPDWFFKVGYSDDGDWVTEEVMIQRMENYIKNVFAALEEEYPTVDIYAYDVVNEAWLDNGSPRTGGTQAENANYSGWVKVFGDNSFIKYAFQFAKQYAPEGCKLYYNDFNEYMSDKTAAIVAMVEELNAEEQLIDGIGCQSHLDVSFPGTAAYEKAIAAFAETGLDIQITELDATIPQDQPTDANFETQAQYYSDIMDICVKYADNISAVILWGVTDDQSWRANKYPLIFDSEFQAKPAYYSIVDGLEVPEVTTTTTTTTTQDTTTTTTTTNDPTAPVAITLSGVVEALEYGDISTVVIDGTEYMLLPNAVETFQENNVQVGDTVSLSGYAKTDSVSIEYISSITVEPGTTTNPDFKYGDANANDEVEVADAVFILQGIADPSNEDYALTEKGSSAANCCDVATSGIDAEDALAIQMFMAEMIDSLPYENTVE